MSQPPEPSPLRLGITNLYLTVPTVVALLAVAGLIGLPLGLVYRSGQGAVAPAPPAEQRWTASSGFPLAVASMAVRGALPGPDPRQRRPPCAIAMGEESINDVCWIRLDVDPPCPDGQAWELRRGKCFARVLEVKAMPREPTSGEGRPRGVADP